MREAKRKLEHTLAIVDVIGNTIAKEADETLYTLAGPEIVVATTKAFFARLTVLYILAVRFAEKLGKLSGNEEGKLLAEITDLPQKTQQILSQVDLT